MAIDDLLKTKREEILVIKPQIAAILQTLQEEIAKNKANSDDSSA